MNIALLRIRLPKWPLKGLERKAQSQSQIVAVRTLIVAPRRRTTNQRKRVPQPKAERSLEMKRQMELRTLDKKLEEVRQFTRDLKLDLAKRDEEKVKRELSDPNEALDLESEDVDIIYRELIGSAPSEDLLLQSEESQSGALSLFNEPARGINIPATVLSRMGDSVKHIISKNNQNWNAVIQDIQIRSEVLKELPKADIYDFLNQIPVGKLNEQSLAQVHQMLVDSEITYGITAYDFMMKHYAELNHPVVVQKLFDSAVQTGIKPTKYMFGHLIKVNCRAQNLERVNLALNKMFGYGLEPSKKVYTNILQMCVQMKDENQADEIFQMMKFRSLQSQPDAEAYNTMIQLTAKTGNVHRALDLYQEMLDAKLEPTVFTFNCLAQACSRDPDFYRRGWEFIHQIHEHRLDPTVSTFEIMLRLAAKDGDLELARALYVKIFEMRPELPTAGPEPLNYLMVAYRDFKPEHVPQITLYREGFIIRRNILNMVDFLGLHQTLVNDTQIQKIREVYPPLLPVRGLRRPEHIISESNALWAFNVARDPSVLNLAALHTYLMVAIEHDDKDEFLRRYEECTFPNGDVGVNQLVLEEAEEAETEKNEQDTKGEVSDPPAIADVKKMNLKLERESSLYLILLSAGRRFQDEQLCQRAWTERGKFRKTTAYQNLEMLTRMRLDFEFSREMVNALTALKHYTDAVGVVASSTQFPWSFYFLKPLYVALVEIGDKNNAQLISALCNKCSKNNYLLKRRG